MRKLFMCIRAAPLPQISFLFEEKVPEAQGGGSAPPPPEKGTEAAPSKEDEKKAAEEAVKLAEDTEAKKAAEVELARIRQLDLQGGPEDFVKTFEESKKTGEFAVMAAFLEDAMKMGIPLSDFDTWPNLANQNDVADFFDKEPFVPHGKGRNAFVEGLRNGDDKSQLALRQIVDMLHKHFEQKRVAKEDIGTQTQKPPLGETISGMARSLITNYNRASGQEKAIMLGAAAVGLMLLYKFKDHKLIGKATPKNLLYFIGAVWSVNYLSGKMSKDGKTLLNRIDVTRSVDDMKDHMIKGYALEHGMENEAKLNTFVRVMPRSVKEVFPLYEEASSASALKREINPKSLGFREGEVSGKALYDIMDDLAKETAVNEEVRRQRAEAEAQGVPFKEPTPAELAKRKAAVTRGDAIAAFTLKYITGPLGSTDQTLFDAVVNEYHTQNWQEAITRGRGTRIPDYTAAKIGELYRQGVKPRAIDAGKWIYEAGGTVYAFTRDEIAYPIGRFVKAKYKKYLPYAAEPVQDGLSYYYQKSYFEKVLPASFDARVTSAAASGPGQVRILGYPNVPFDAFTNSDGKDVVKVWGAWEFVVDKGVAGNTKVADEVKKIAEGKVQALIDEKAKSVPLLKAKKPQWNETDKKWEITGVELLGNSVLGVAKGSVLLQVTVDDNEKPHFFMNGQEVKNFADLQETYTETEVKKEVITLIKNAGLSTMPASLLESLPLEITKIESAAAGLNPVVRGTFGGLEFTAQLSSSALAGGIEFYDPVAKKPITPDDLKIAQGNGGIEFSVQLAARVSEDPYFTQPFLTLQALISNTSESVIDRIGELGVGNFKGALNGKILKREWMAVLDFKKAETLTMFEEALHDKGLDGIDAVYKDYIVNAHTELDKLTKYISSLSDEDKAKEFQKLLNGQGDISKGIPDGLELLNYTNNDYQKLYADYKTRITEAHFNYAGLDRLEMPGSGASFEIYQFLLAVWSSKTREYSRGDGSSMPGTLKPATKGDLNKIIGDVVGKLERAQTAGGGTITKESLKVPSSFSDADIDAWWGSI